MALLALALVGAVSAWAQRWALSEESRVRWALAAVAGAALVAGGVLSLAARMEVVQYLFASTALRDAYVGLVTLLLLLGAVHTAAVTWFDRLPRFGRRDAWRAVRRMMPVLLGCMILAGAVHGMAPRAESVEGAGGSLAAKLLAGILVMLLGVNAGGFSRTLAARGMNRLASAVILLMPTLGCMIVGFILLRVALAQAGSEFSRAGLLLGLDTPDATSFAAVVWRWCWLYLLSMFAIGGGGALVLRMGPRPAPSLLAVSELTALELQLARREHARGTPPPRRQRVRVGEFVGDVLLPLGEEATEQSGDPATEADRRADTAAVKEAGDTARRGAADVGPDAPSGRDAQRSATHEVLEGASAPATAPDRRADAAAVKDTGEVAGDVPRAPVAYRTDVTPATPRTSYKRHERSTSHLFPTRWHYLLFALLYAAFCFYASLVPVNYQPLAWGEAWSRFVDAQHFGINMDRRADLLANFVLFVPLGFALIAAFDVDRHRRRVGVAALPFVYALIAAFVVAMEFAQTMFPPRTVSQNDMWAEFFGAGVGMLIWFGIGQPVTLAARQLVSQWGSAMARQRMLQAYAAALVVYTLLPLDLTLSLEEIGQKWQRGRVHLMPFRAQRETGMMLAVFMRDLLLFVPIGVMLRLGWESRPRLRSVAMTMLLVVAAAAALEVAKLFVFTNHSDTTKIIARAVGGWLGAVAVGRLVNIQGAVAVGHRMRSYQRLALSLLLVGAVACMAMLLLWEPYHRVTSRREFHEQLGLLLGWPFAGYYWVGEWTALTQLVQFALLFVPIGMLLAWGMNRRRAWSAARQVCVVMVVAGLIGIVAEVGQAAVVAYVPYDAVYASAAGTPLFEPIGSPVSQIDSQRERILQYGPLPDLTDLAAYLAGAVGGWLMARMFLARIVDAGDRSRAMPHAT